MLNLARVALVCFSVLTLPLSLGQHVSAQDSNKGTIVAIVYDGTVESDCQQSIQEGDGPVKPLICPAGSVIFAIRMTEQEAMNNGFTGYLVLTGKEDADYAAIIESAVALHEAIAGVAETGGVRAFVPLAATCGVGQFSLTGSYVNPRSGGRTYYAFGYHRNSDCSVSSVVDQSYRTGIATIRWDLSCSNSNLSCANRFFNLTSNWSGSYGVPGSRVGYYYSHYSSCTSGCGISNGVQSLGFQTFQ